MPLTFSFYYTKKLPISSIRVKKFAQTPCSMLNRLRKQIFKHLKLKRRLKKTIRYEFIDKIDGHLFYTGKRNHHMEQNELEQTIR